MLYFLLISMGNRCNYFRRISTDNHIVREFSVNNTAGSYGTIVADMSALQDSNSGTDKNIVANDKNIRGLDILCSVNSQAVKITGVTCEANPNQAVFSNKNIGMSCHDIGSIVDDSIIADPNDIFRVSCFDMRIMGKK